MTGARSTGGQVPVPPLRARRTRSWCRRLRDKLNYDPAVEQVIQFLADNARKCRRGSDKDKQDKLLDPSGRSSPVLPEPFTERDRTSSRPASSRPERRRSTRCLAARSWFAYSAARSCRRANADAVDDPLHVALTQARLSTTVQGTACPEVADDDRSSARARRGRRRTSPSRMTEGGLVRPNRAKWYPDEAAGADNAEEFWFPGVRTDRRSRARACKDDRRVRGSEWQRRRTPYWKLNTAN